jgi:hypothetical protein
MLNPLGVLSSDVAIGTGNLVWVDQVNGNDSLAVRGMTIPFRTLTAAKTSAKSGDTIMVMPGNYNEKNLLKNGVNWHFLAGAIIQPTGSSAGGLFDTTSNGAGGVASSFVTGHGEFNMSGSSHSTAQVLNCDAACYVSIQARSISAQAAAVKITAGTCQVQVLEDMVCLTDAIVANGGLLTVYSRDIWASGGCCLRAQSGSGKVDIVGRTLASTTDNCVSIETSAATVATIRAYEIRTDASGCYGVIYSCTSGAILTILGSRIRNTFAGSGAHAVYISSSSNDKLKLANCVLIGGSGASASMKALAATRVHILNGAAANIGFTNITPVGGTLNTPDSTIS